MLYGTITEFCTEESCPIMSAGPKYEYHWADGHTVKKPIKCSAPKYIDYLMTWVQDQLDDETLFPSKIGIYIIFCTLFLSIFLKTNPLILFFAGVPFPKNFLSIAKTILKRLFRVYAHIYHQHFSEVVQLGEEAHLNTSFKHFIFFVQVLLLLYWSCYGIHILQPKKLFVSRVNMRDKSQNRTSDPIIDHSRHLFIQIYNRIL